MRLERTFVEDVIYGWSGSRRFLQDDPVRPDVWIAFAEAPGRPRDLLLEPHFSMRPGAVVAGLRTALRAAERTACRLAYNQSSVTARMTLEQVVRVVLPRTAWWAEATAIPGSFGPNGDGTAVPDRALLRRDLESLLNGRRLDGYTHEVLTLVRVVGLLAFAALASADDRGLFQAHRDRGDAASEAAFLDILCACIADGWERMFKNRLPTRADGDGRQVHSVNLDRPAALAVHRSALTIKADAARLLFNIDCSEITWAIIDAGIDATHPAFGHGRPTASRNGWGDDPGGMPVGSRVIETYDFTGIRDLLVAASQSPNIERALARNGGTRLQETFLKTRAGEFAEMHNRLKAGRDIDWEVLTPILRVPHDADYKPPKHPHGTHVAGILGANWPKTDGTRPKGDVMGICPDIRLIDIRVCRDDGGSDEFTIMSALQFLRHLNARRDRMAVHGANISLSLKHDVANFACGRTPLCEEAERLVAAGVVVVAAAGNNGYNRFRTVRDESHYEGYCAISITDPGNAESVITVGSTHRFEPHSYGVSYFSSRGPTGDGRVKPDLVAPGEKIDSTVPGGGYTRMDGTSMAAPHVSGAAALLMARNNELIGEPHRVKRILCSTATDLGRERYFQGHGLVDVLRALQSV